MMTRRALEVRMALGLGAMLSLAIASATLAGPVWDEASGADAGSAPPSAQQTDGSGDLTRIKGELEGATAATVAGSGPGDFEDMYVIRVRDPMEFKASTVFADGGAASFDTQLWLFRPGAGNPLLAFGVLANDDTAIPFSPQSRLLPDPTDGSASLSTPGIHYLAITGFDNDPLSAGGLIFLQASPTEISGPDGQGGGMPLASWSDCAPLKTGTYEIRLDGVTYATQATIDCNGNGVHDMCDIAAGTSTDVNLNQIPDECEADVDDDGDGDVQDLLLLLGAWGPCPMPPPRCPADINGDGVVDVVDLLFLLAQWS